MPNQNERPKYTDPDHPYSGSGPRYQNNYNRNEYHAGDGPFKFPWWAIVIGFVVWWPLGFIFIGLNTAMKNGKLGGFEEKARVRGAHPGHQENFYLAAVNSEKAAFWVLASVSSRASFTF